MHILAAASNRSGSVVNKVVNIRKKVVGSGIWLEHFLLLESGLEASLNKGQLDESIALLDQLLTSMQLTRIQNKATHCRSFNDQF